MKKVVCLLLSIALLLSLASCVSRDEVNDITVSGENGNEIMTTEENSSEMTIGDESRVDEIEPIIPPETSFAQKNILKPFPQIDDLPKTEGGSKEEESKTDLKEDVILSASEHETSIPQSALEEQQEEPIDVSNDKLEILMAIYFSLPQSTLCGGRLYQKIKQMYLSGEWDGLPFNVGEHIISMSSKGYIQVDNTFIDGKAEPLDLPNQSRYKNGVGIIDDCNIQYIPGQGSYILIDDTYMRYLRGQNIPLEGEPLNWKEQEGVDVNYGHAILCYAKTCDKMFLLTPSLDDPSVNYTYLYIFPDYNVSEIEFVAKFNGTFLYNTKENTVYYQDMDNEWWMYCENKDGSYYFEMIS